MLAHLLSEVGSIIGACIPILPETSAIVDAVKVVKQATTAEEAIAAAAAAVALVSETVAKFPNEDGK